MAKFYRPNFRKYFLNVSKYAKKEQIVSDFFDIWFEIHRWGIDYYECSAVRDFVSKPADKKKIRALLLGRGHSAAAVTSFIKQVLNWTNANT